MSTPRPVVAILAPLSPMPFMSLNGKRAVAAGDSSHSKSDNVHIEMDGNSYEGSEQGPRSSGAISGEDNSIDREIGDEEEDASYPDG